MDNYTFDKCAICNKYTALKNGICADCKNDNPLPDFFENLFREKDNK
jgi:hypothetical protein